ncbi:MAG TPA: transposase, partial [Cyanobacteria bacterium UBA11371]|nr:transposase [Cyanobacteria bacterium UBA11371]
QGIEQGIVQASRNYIIQFLQIRFGEVPSSIVEVINGINDSAMLQSLFTRAIAINSLAEFQQVLDEVLPGE